MYIIYTYIFIYMCVWVNPSLRGTCSLQPPLAPMHCVSGVKGALCA